MKNRKPTRRDVLLGGLAVAATPLLPATIAGAGRSRRGCHVVCRMHGASLNASGLTERLGKLVDALPEEMPIEIDFHNVRAGNPSPSRGIEIDLDLDWSFTLPHGAA